MNMFLILILNLLFNFSWANTVSSIACDPLSALSSPSAETLDSRSQIQNFLKNSENYIKEKIESKDWDAVAVACGLVDDVTEGFTKLCLDDTDTAIDLKPAQQACEDHINK